MPKPSRSPLYFYATEYRNRQRTSGKRLNISEAIGACYDEWKALSEEEKQPYKNQYEEWRLQYRINPESTTTTTIPNQHTKLIKQISNDKILHQRDIPCEELKQHYDRFSSERNFLACEYLPLDKSELLSMPIYLINFQIFCKVDEEDGGQIIPAEMCILRYTLTDGVTVYRQRFIKPEQIPTGYMSSCLEQSKETHEIPLKDFGDATNNYKLIYQELKSFLLPTITNKLNNNSDNDDRTRRRYLRLSQPCIYYPSVEYEQTIKVFDWLQEKGEGKKPTKDTRLVNLASIESLIMVLAELKNHRVSRDDLQKTFENASYSYLIEERCPYHLHVGISHCSVARCHAAAKLISNYLNQLYVPEKSVSVITGKSSSRNSSISTTHESSIDSMNNNSSYRNQQSVTMRPTTTPERFLPHQYSSIDTTDSIASSYGSSEQNKHRSFPQSNDQITKLQQENFHRLLSNAESTYSSNNNNNNNNNHLSEYSSNSNNSIHEHPNIHRTFLNQRKQILLQALQHIDQQIEELDIE